MTANKEIQAAVISDPKHIFYFTGFSTSRPRYSCFLVLRRSDDAILFLGSSALDRLESKSDLRVVTFGDYNIHANRMVSYGDYVSEKLYEFIKQEMINWNSDLLGIEAWHLPSKYSNALKKGADANLVDVSSSILNMRKTKGADELNFEREASRRLFVAYKKIKEKAFVGETELGLYAEANASNFRNFDSLEYFEVSNVFGDYVSGEKRTLGGAGGPTKRKLRKGDLLILDLQASYKRYWVDACRTYLVGSGRGRPKPTQRQEDAFRVILKAKKRAEALLKPGSTGSQIYKSVSDTIVESGFKPLQHHAGHGLGLDDQEPPFFLPNSGDTLEVGVVCAVEPGIYDKSFGGMRIEDNYIITKDGFENISKFPIGFP